MFGLSLYAWSQFVSGVADFQFVEQRSWFGSGLSYKMGVDGISFPFVVLTAFLMPFCIAASWTVDRHARQGIHGRLPGA